MSTPLATIFHGDVTLEQGSDVDQFGWGSLNVNSRIMVNGTEDSTGAPTVGSIVTYGGVRIAKSLHVQQDAYVLYGRTYLTETHIDTTNGPTTVTGGNKVDISVGASSQFVSTDGNLSLVSSTKSLQLYGGLNGTLAVDIKATDAGGGVNILSGVNNGINLIGGSNGIYGITSAGNVSLIANNGSGSFIVNSSAGNQDIGISLNGATDSQISIQSAGINTTKTAMVLNTTNPAGNIQISNYNGLGGGKVDVFTGAGGYNVLTNTLGTITLTSQAANSLYQVNSAGTNQNLTLSLNGKTDSSLILQSDGINTTNPAIWIKNTNTAGNIKVSQPANSVGYIDFFSGTGGFRATTLSGGSIQMNAYGASSTYTNTTLADGQNLTVSVTGNTDSKVIISSTGKSNQAIKLETTNGSGGIYMTSVGTIQLESTNVNHGVNIATLTSNVPVRIGTANSTTTIYGNLDVKGVTTTIESTVVTVEDNIIVVNNAPSGTGDGGLAIKRWQPVNITTTDASYYKGDVIADNPEETGTAQNGSATMIQLESGANGTNDYYNGWWVKITAGTGIGQVRRIKSYNGTNKEATIYDTADQTGVLGNPEPIEGADFITYPDSTSEYALYPCHYVMAIWDESANEFALICSPNNPSDNVGIAHYSDLHINDLTANEITANYINGSIADITTTVTLTNSSSTPVSISGFPQNYGVYLVFVKPQVTTTRAHAIFMIGRVNSITTPGTVVRLISVKGTQNEQLDMQWPANSNPEIYYRPTPVGGTGTTVYNVKIITL